MSAGGMGSRVKSQAGGVGFDFSINRGNHQKPSFLTLNCLSPNGRDYFEEFHIHFISFVLSVLSAYTKKLSYDTFPSIAVISFYTEYSSRYFRCPQVSQGQPGLSCFCLGAWRSNPIA